MSKSNIEKEFIAYNGNYEILKIQLMIFFKK
jgi:hypothetical protein